MLPVAAVGGLADSGVVTRMARSRVWIGVLGLLLGGIVALNVWGLSLSAAGSATTARIDALQRDNGVLRKRIASRLSTGKVEAEAVRLGLEIPAPTAVHYLDAKDGDIARAAARLARGEIATALAPVAAAPTELVATDVEAVEPAVPTDATAVAPATEAPVVEPGVPTETAVVADVPAETTAPPITEPATTDPAAGGVVP